MNGLSLLLIVACFRSFFFRRVVWAFSSQVNGRIISKQIHVRVEHVSPSKCRDELKRRVKENEATKKAARAGGGEFAAFFFCFFALTERSLLYVCYSSFTNGLISIRYIGIFVAI